MSTTQAALHIHDLHHAYASHQVLRGIHIDLQAGELVGLVGPNGTGKSTLIRCICGAEAIQQGRVLIAGIDIARDRQKAQAQFGYAVDVERLPALLTARQALQLVADVRGEASSLSASYALCETLGMSPWLDRRIHEYSLGTRQKLAIALALLGRPALIVLDEVLNGLDPLAAFALKQELQERTRAGACVLLATHGLEVAERFLDRALLLLDGQIAADWNGEALRGFRADPDGGLEHAVVLRLRAAARDRESATG
jgi:ABC-2 type transport system ATP-binding protein